MVMKMYVVGSIPILKHWYKFDLVICNQTKLQMDFKNVNINDYCLNLDLHKSMFFIDMLKDTYEFTLKGDEIEIFKKIKNSI